MCFCDFPNVASEPATNIDFCSSMGLQYEVLESLHISEVPENMPLELDLRSLVLRLQPFVPRRAFTEEEIRRGDAFLTLLQRVRLRTAEMNIF